MKKERKELSMDLSFYDLFIELQEILEKEDINKEKIPFYINQMLKSINYLNKQTYKDLFNCGILKYYLNRMSINRYKYEQILKSRLENLNFEKESLSELREYLFYMKKTQDYQHFTIVLKTLLSVFSIQKQRIEHMKKEAIINNPNCIYKDLEESKLKKQVKENVKQLKFKRSEK